MSTQVDSVFFFYIYIFKLSFVNVFNLFFIGLLQSHDLVHVFDRLTRLDLIHLTRSFFI
jgi:hypothetical protein